MGTQPSLLNTEAGMGSVPEGGGTGRSDLRFTTLLRTCHHKRKANKLLNYKHSPKISVFVSIAAMPSYHELSGLNEHRFILLNFWGSESNTMMLTGLHFPLELQGRIYFLAFSGL